MIDIHSHILPAVPMSDDGSPSMDMSLQLLDAAAKDGVTEIICTPHDSPGIFEAVARIRTELEPEAAKRGIKLHCGCEYNISHVSWSKEPYVPLAGTSFLLIEFSSGFLCPATENLIFELQRKGFKLIVAHPERSFTEIKHVERLADLGMFFQLTASSVLGMRGSKISSWSLDLLSAGYCHFIASDAHNLRRTYQLQPCREKIASFFGPESANRLFDENQALLLQNKAPHPIAPARLSFFQKLSWTRSKG